MNRDLGQECANTNGVDPCLVRQGGTGSRLGYVSYAVRAALKRETGQKKTSEAARKQEIIRQVRPGRKGRRPAIEIPDCVGTDDASQAPECIHHADSRCRCRVAQDESGKIPKARQRRASAYAYYAEESYHQPEIWKQYEETKKCQRFRN
jgi:hypothetical protein